MTEEIVPNPENKYVVVSNNLKIDQPIFDQPPYNWMVADDELFPDDFFKDKTGFPKLLRAVALKGPEFFRPETRNTTISR